MSNATIRTATALGIAGMMTLATPTPAYAATAAQDPMPYMSFALGCVTGVAVTSSVALLLTMRERTAATVGDHSKARVGRSQAIGRHAARELAERGVRVQPVSASVERESALTDYVDVAAHYVQNLGMTSRMAVRAAGVRDTLLDRLGGNPFDDVPVIERAEVGQGDFTRFGKVASRPAADDVPFVGEGSDAVTTADLGRVREGASVASAPSLVGAPPHVRSAYIASKVAEVQNGAFPERRSSEELDGADAFDQALAAMDARMGKEFPGVRTTVQPVYVSVESVAAIPAATAVVSASPIAQNTVAMSDSPFYTDDARPSPLVPNEPLKNLSGTDSFLRVIPGGQNNRRPDANGSYGHGGAGRHFRREAIAL